MRQVGYTFPITKRTQTSHTTQTKLHIYGLLQLSALVSFERIFPTLQLLVPRFFDLQAMMLLGIGEDTYGSFGLLKLIVDTNQSLNRWSRSCMKFQLFVVKSLGISMYFLGKVAQRTDFNRQ